MVVDVHDVAARLESSPVGVEVKVRHRLFDADAEAHVLLGEGVDGVHKVGVVWREPVCGGHAFKEGAGRVQACKGDIARLARNMARERSSALGRRTHLRVLEKEGSQSCSGAEAFSSLKQAKGNDSP